MIKRVVMLKAKAGMARDAFIKRYETGHVPLILKLIPYFRDYRRNYVIPNSMITVAHLKKGDFKLDFDVLTELWHEDQAQLDRLRKTVGTTNAGELIAEDETHFFDRSKIVMAMTDERVTPAELLAPRPADHEGPPAVTMVCLLKKKPGMSRDDFMTYYETGHVVLTLKLLSKNGRGLFAGYRRNYPVPGTQRKLGEGGPCPPDADYDVLTEITFWTEADYEAFQAACAVPETGKLITADEEKLFDRDAMILFLVEPYNCSRTEVDKAIALKKAG